MCGVESKNYHAQTTDTAQADRKTELISLLFSTPPPDPAGDRTPYSRSHKADGAGFLNKPRKCADVSCKQTTEA